MKKEPDRQNQLQRLTKQRCYHHGGREAVVCCPNCQRYYCRECVTEHRHQMLCSDCLTRLVGQASTTQGRWSQGWGLLVQGIFGFMVLWYAFYLVGLMLLAIPHDFHEGTIWQEGWWKLP